MLDTNFPAQKPAAAPADETLHVVVLTAFNTRAALLAVDGALAAANGAKLNGLSLKPLGELVEGVLRVHGVDEAAAEGLCEDLAAGLGVRSARLEHQWPLRRAG